MLDHGALIGSLGIELDRAPEEAPPNPLAFPLRDKAREPGHAFGSANGLNVLVEHFVGFRRAGRLLEIIVRRLVDRFAVHDIEERRDRRTIALAMAGPAGDDLASQKFARLMVSVIWIILRAVIFLGESAAQSGT